MIDLAETRYVKTRENVHIAYQVIGDGPLDLVLVPNSATHVEAMWDQPGLRRTLEALASFGRLIVYDQPGTGLSDPVSMWPLQTFEHFVDDLITVLDHAESGRPAVLGFEGGCMVGAMLAATHPERTRALVLANGHARFHRAIDYPWGIAPEEFEGLLEHLTETWGVAAPTASVEEQSWARYQRQAASPGTFAAMLRVGAQVDIRSVLPAIRVPTLVLVHREPTHARRHDGARGEELPAEGRYLAEHIPGAQYVETVADEPRPPGDMTVFIEETRAFLTGVRQWVESDRVLATLLFTDIVGSTARAAEIGDARWSQLLDAHDDMVVRQLERFRGRKVKGTGDGVLASFDGPARAIRCACAIRDSAHRLELQVRAGLHTGEIEVRGDDVSGIAVHVAARVAALAEADEVLVSGTVTELVVGSGISFRERGAHELKGVPGQWRLLAVADL